MIAHIKHFRYYRSPLRGIKDTLSPTPIPGFSLLPKGGKTVVRLEDEETGALVGIGMSTCNKTDSYNKTVGRVIATSRAIESGLNSVETGKRPVIVKG